MVYDENSSLEKKILLFKETPSRELGEALGRESKRFVRYVVRKEFGNTPLSNSRYDYSDLVGEGIAGFWEGLERYDPSRNTRALPFIQRRIKGSIQDFLRGIDFLKRSDRENLKSFIGLSEGLREKLGREPSYEELENEWNQEELGSSVLTFEDFWRTVLPLRYPFLFSVLEGAYSETDFATIDDFLSSARLYSSEGLPPEDSLEREELRVVLERDLQDIARRGMKGRRNASIVRSYLFEGRRMREIGELWGITESRVAQIITGCNLAPESRKVHLRRTKAYLYEKAG